MLRARLINLVRRTVRDDIRTFCIMTQVCKVSGEKSTNLSDRNNLLSQNKLDSYIIKRFKHQNKKHTTSRATDKDKDSDTSSSENESSSEDDVEGMSKFEDLPVYMKTRETVYCTVVIPTARLDTVAKAVFGTSRKNIEMEFYNCKVRVNGEPKPKKSIEITEGDEIDLIIGRDYENPRLLRVKRAFMSTIRAVPNGTEVNAAVQKNLLIENYPSPWKEVA